ncbi:MAG: glycogen debranching protein GlgX [Chthoniobacterales bacterium]
MKNPATPTHTHKDFKLRYGQPIPFGATPVPGGVNFALFSAHATHCTLVLFKRGDREPFEEIPFPPEFRIGDVFAMIVFDLDIEAIEYGYRVDGPNKPALGHRFNPKKVLLDPYAKEVSDGWDLWTLPDKDLPVGPDRGRILVEDFDWGHDRQLSIPEKDLVIYEMHLRGFTRHDSSRIQNAGTYEGMRQKIPYLKKLGVNCVEIMPIFAFDEFENTRTNPLTGTRLVNYWGYSTLGFFAPHAAFAATAAQGKQANEFKQLVQDLHAEGIEVILDVVFNHTAEQGENGPMISFRGIDNATYYMLLPDGAYANYTGCGNTLNANHPVVRKFVIDCLRYWAGEYHVDGFRFDLASALGRASDGSPLANPPLLEEIAYDPVLSNCDLIAEAWDAGGLYQVGNFPSYRRWCEWNGKFRDTSRKFLRGDPGVTGEMVQRIMGSPDLYAAAGRKPTASINFITCHDGFTLRDLVSYNEKHNLANGENNGDGNNDNISYNYGAEGDTDDAEINTTRLRQQKNAMALLFLSQGVPMIYMGDECGRTQNGNNNAYCHDEAWNWFDWTLPDKNAELFRFCQKLIAFRKANPALTRDEFLTGHDQVGSGYADISWHGTQPWKPDWTPNSHTLAFLLCGKHTAAEGGPPHFIYCMMNMFTKPLEFTLPVIPKGMTWFRAIDTAGTALNDITDPGQEAPFSEKTITLHDRSIVVLIGR